MDWKAARVFLFATAATAIVLNGIHLAHKDEMDRLKSTLDVSVISYRDAVAECRTDPGECLRAEELRSRVARVTEDLKQATRQAWLFLALSVAVPCVLVVLGLGVRWLARSRRNRASADAEVMRTIRAAR